MNTTISEAAVEAACVVVYSSYTGGSWNYRIACENEMRDALEAALPHLQPAKPEAVRLRDELRERAEFEAWAEGRYNLDKRVNVVGDLVYADRWVQGAFVGWQAALAATGKQQDGCTESNCRRCLTHPDHRGDIPHAGIGSTGKQQVGEVPDSASRLIDAIEGECAGLVISPETAAAILDHVCLGDPWRDAVFSEWALTFIDPKSEVPAEILRAVIKWNVRTALDPSVSSDAAALVSSGKQVGEVQEPSSLVDRLREHADLYSPGELRSTLTEVAKALAARPPVDSAEQLDRALGETIDQRDRYHDAADDLASYIARITRVEIGEHSSDNCPWENAMRAAEQYKSANLGEIRQFRALIEFALWQALTLPETDPRRDFIRQGNQLIALIHGQAVQS